MIPEFLSLPDRRLAYQQWRGRPGGPGLIFLCGYASDMTGSKAEFLSQRCADANFSFLRFDYRGTGQSGGVFTDATLGDWFDDGCTMFDRFTEGPQIVIGSSMGGWLALMLALQKPERIRAMIGIAAGPDFTEDLLLPEMSPQHHAQLERDGLIHMGAPPHALPVTKRFIEEARNHLLLRDPLPVGCPVRLLQGMEDEDIPWRHALRIAEAIPHGDVRITFVKDGGHRLSRPQDLDALWNMIGEFV